MTQAASPGLGIAFAVQTAKGTKVTNGALFKKLGVINGRVGQQQALGQFPQEVGGGYHAPGRYKMFGAGVGNATWQPRLQDDIGHLLYAFFGSVSAATSEAGPIYHTTFRPVADYCNHPWLTARSFLPNCAAVSNQLGEEIYDAKLTTLNFNVQAGQPAVTQMAFLAINSGTASDVSNWSSAMTDTIEDTSSVIISSVDLSGLTIGGLSLTELGGGVGSDFTVPAITMQIQMQNTFSGDGVRPELVIGKSGMDDLALLRQDIGFSLVYKWKDPNLYKAIYNWRSGVGNGWDWSPEVLKSDVVIKLRSPKYVYGTTYQELEIGMESVSLDCPQGLQLEGGGFVTLQITGQAEIQSTVPAFAYAKLTNGTAYTDYTTYSA